MKTVLITGGMDWTDAGADLLEVPDDLVIADEYVMYRNWVLTLTDRKRQFLTFVEWLKAHRGAKDSSKERFHEE